MGHGLASYNARMDVLSNFWSPLCAVGAHGPAGPNAQICVSVFGASIVPDRPRLMVCLHKTNYTHDLVVNSGTLAITLLSSSQTDLLAPLGLETGRDGDKLGDLCFVTTPAGDPYFPGGAGMLDCEVLRNQEMGDATAFLVAVRASETWDAEPMRWHDVRDTLDASFMSRWQAKSLREQEVARDLMVWRD